MKKHNHLLLLVDDEPVSLMMLEKALSGTYRVRTARSAEEALEVLNYQEVALLITDQRMPGMSGTELLRVCRTLYPEMVGFLLTAEHDISIFVEAIVNLGALCVIRKPWEAAQVLRTIDSALKKYEGLHRNKVAIDQLKQASLNLDKLVKH
ncbi:MAG: response regulator [Acidobacteria bacterium]|nr:response regulator [Acidobacteriota bacterium]